MLDLRDWGWIRPDQQLGFDYRGSGDRVRIVWAGTNTHDEDLKIITSALLHICENYGDKVEVLVLGDAPPQWIGERFPQVQEVPFVPFANYARTLSELKPDIGLCPLIGSRFNSCKTHVKWMEYTAAGAAVVASNHNGVHGSPYSELGDVAKVVLNDTVSWIDAIDDLVKSQEERKRLWSLSAAKLVDQYSWQAGKKGRRLWIDIFKALAQPV